MFKPCYLAESVAQIKKLLISGRLERNRQTFSLRLSRQNIKNKQFSTLFVSQNLLHKINYNLINFI